MSDLGFFNGIVPLALGVVAARGHASLPDGAEALSLIRAVAPLDRADAGEVAACRTPLDRGDLATTRATACFVTADDAGLLAPGTIPLVTRDPAAAIARIAALLHPDSVRPGSAFHRIGIDPAAIIHGEARLETGVSIDPGAIVGPRAEIGTGTSVGANATIGPGVRIGRGCAIDALVSISNAFIGDRVVIHAGARIGQGDAGTGPRLGRVIVQNDVEIGANATIARGSLDDTVLGEGCRIGTGVAIGPDVLVERNTTTA